MISKKKFFKNKIEDVTMAIWESEFKVKKSREVREGVRQDRDRALEAMNIIQGHIEAEEDAAKKEELQKQFDANQADKERFEKQMAMIDKQINGGEDEPGLLPTIESFVELRRMYKEHLKDC